MKKSLNLLLVFAIILVQSCVSYYPTSVSLYDAYETGKVKVESTQGDTFFYSNIELVDGTYYGIKGKRRIQLDSAQLRSIQLVDPAMTSIRNFNNSMIIILAAVEVFWY